MALIEGKNQLNRKNVVFLSSSMVNCAKLFAQNNPRYDVFLIHDRRFPFDIEDEDLENFYSFVFDKKKVFERNKEQYFDTLGVFINEYSPNFIITNNFTKLLPKSFIDFVNFTNPKIKILNIHHGDLRILDENNDMLYKGLRADMKEFLDEAMIISTIHKIEDENMDTGEQITYSYETTLKELKNKGLVNKKEDILNLRLRNVILSYHERTKVLTPLRKAIEIIEYD